MMRNRILWMCLMAVLSASLLSCGSGEAPQTEVTVPTTTTDRTREFNEPLRPQYHFTPPSNWMNDPNGMVYYEGEYHLFYQYNPDSTVWGPMHWGHAISKDLVRWEHLPIALYPDPLGYIFSGSAVVDWNNTSGFSDSAKPPLVAIFTHHDPKGERTESTTFQRQSLAYSNDNGRSWTKYDGNPVLDNPGMRDFRDPKVIWHKPTKRWVMVVAAANHVRIYTSPNLREWTYQSDFGQQYGSHDGMWECPDLFPMTVQKGSSQKWVLLQSMNPGGPNGGSGTQYFVGDFDGRKFTPHRQHKNTDTTRTQIEQAFWLDYGRDNYAGVTWSDLPRSDLRSVFIGWMSNWDYAQVVPTENWRSAMTIPRSLHLVSTGGGYRLESRPVEELKKLRQSPCNLAPTLKSAGTVAVHELCTSTTTATAELVLRLSANSNLSIELRNANNDRYVLTYDSRKQEFVSDRRATGMVGFSEQFASEQHIAPRHSRSDLLELRIFLDRSSIECFADNGSTVITELFFPTLPFDQLTITSSERSRIDEAQVYELKSIW